MSLKRIAEENRHFQYPIVKHLKHILQNKRTLTLDEFHRHYDDAKDYRITLVGPSGSGKTRLLRKVTGDETPNVAFDVDIDGIKKKLRANPHKGLYEGENVIERVASEIIQKSNIPIQTKYDITRKILLTNALSPEEETAIRMSDIRDDLKENLVLGIDLANDPDDLNGVTLAVKYDRELETIYDELENLYTVSFTTNPDIGRNTFIGATGSACTLRDSVIQVSQMFSTWVFLHLDTPELREKAIDQMKGKPVNHKGRGYAAVFDFRNALYEHLAAIKIQASEYYAVENHKDMRALLEDKYREKDKNPVSVQRP